jgi:hypothetical protein
VCPIKAIRYSELMTLIGNLAVAGETLNNYLIPLRAVFEVARQLGHTNANMLFRVYSNWIDGADKSRERDKLNIGFGHGIDRGSEDIRAIKYERPET